MMKEIKICVLSVSVLLFASFFKLSVTVNIYIALILATFLLTVLLLYKKPEFSEFKFIDIFSIIAAVFFVYSVVFLLLKKNSFLVYPAITVCLFYLYFVLRTAKNKTLSKKNVERERLALRTGMCFDLEMRRLAEKEFNLKGLTKDLSTTGMKVFSQDSFDKGDECCFRLYLPQENWPLTGEAEVVWKKSVDKGYEYGMVFTKMSDRDRGKLALKQGFSLLE
ncbi:MAG: PilZ domain-containing protein [Candidatus Kaelpia imicola]|nr:PilZ domain-containing protein [Candidatus Kaelpia imicola]